MRDEVDREYRLSRRGEREGEDEREEERGTPCVVVGDCNARAAHPLRTHGPARAWHAARMRIITCRGVHTKQ